MTECLLLVLPFEIEARDLCNDGHMTGVHLQR
jgi:hypothetical protein